MPLSRPVRISLWVAAGLLISLSVTIAVIVNRFEPVARDYFTAALKQRYKTDVELRDLQISLVPSVRAVGTGLTLRMPESKNLPPLIVVRRFTLEAGFTDFFRTPKRIRRISFEGLQIHVPPKSERPHMSSGAGRHSEMPFILEEVVADGTTLETLPADPKKDPLTFAIRQLTLRTAGVNRPMTFHAELINAKPPGFIHSDGQFGPWNEDEPSETPLGGKYTFSDADLSVFKGISGKLSSSGEYRGKLDRLAVQGTTDVPDFSLKLASHSSHLRTAFEATVDGTNGNTDLHPVRALLDDSAFEVTGTIERNALQKHKEIDLHASAKSTDIEDFIRISVRSEKPPMTGKIDFDSEVKIPPGEVPVVDRLQLDGEFTLTGVKFTSRDVQEKIANLSRRAQGNPSDSETYDVKSQFAGRFKLQHGRLLLPSLHFSVPGANVALRGQYALRSGALDFTGTAKMEATVSQMTTGIKHILLKPIDPLFKRDGAGAVLPIKISGTRGSPSFKLDIGRVLKRK